jgi:hypothetical protein
MSVIKDAENQAVAVSCVTLFTGMVKAVGIFLGNGEQYADADTI